MSDLLFVGVSPKSEIGKEYSFQSMDDWIDVHRLIIDEISEKFSDPSEWGVGEQDGLAGGLEELLDFGVASAYFLHLIRFRNMSMLDIGEGEFCVKQLPEEGGPEVVRMMSLLRGFVQFLRETNGVRCA